MSRGPSKLQGAHLESRCLSNLICLWLKETDIPTYIQTLPLVQPTQERVDQPTKGGGRLAEWLDTLITITPANKLNQWDKLGIRKALCNVSIKLL